MASASKESTYTTYDRTGLIISPAVGLTLGLVAGLLTFGFVQAFDPLFHVPKEVHVPSIGMPPELFAAHRRQQDRVDRWHAMLYTGELGLLVGGALGLAEGVVRRSWLPLLLAAPTGALGGAVGASLGCAVYEYVRANVGQAELMHTIGAELLLSVPLGLGVGIGLGLATLSPRSILRLALAGMASGVLAGVVYPLAISILFPDVSTDALLSDEWRGRLLWLSVSSGLLGLVIPLGSRRRELLEPQE